MRSRTKTRRVALGRETTIHKLVDTLVPIWLTDERTQTSKFETRWSASEASSKTRHGLEMQWQV